MSLASVFNLAALVVTLAAACGWVNHRWFRLPHTIGLVLIALGVSFAALLLDAVAPALRLESTVRDTLTQIDFHDTLMTGMLGFLLFAGALHVDLAHLVSRCWAISTLATVGILLSTGLVGAATYLLTGLAGLDLPLPYCFVFGALISPTDPIAVLAILKKTTVPETLEAKIAGESLFNDGVGVVLFSILVVVATGGGEHGATPTAGGIARLFLTEAGGGVVLGLAAGYVAYRAMRAIDEHNLEVLITLALVMGTYALALQLHLSGPIAMVVAGLFIGNHGTQFAMSAGTRDHVEKFWSLLDEILNSLLFLAIGFEVFALTLTPAMLWVAAAAIPLVLTARFISVSLPILTLRPWQDFTPGAIPVLTWGGLRGGISVALALSLPSSPLRDTILAATYGVVVFSIVVQGLTIERVVRATVK
ncbi:MAG: sodium:proton antiporter [Acidobacteria bacterium]|jgi:CPA1 family monovalent cation:H+ antiporter|nr:sodium:proton antiporter [Acidobacteriota bacterium]MDP7480214.1 sodium:proton antiporter [Vicinamibacterales bacterium]MDP7693270.1 sodium:proton antiporter [Vicinamibacterales bacterium]HJN46140.1 sodium:proton antiporter [Vicinamibacterales bacterium]|tara:strand:- start:1393 stop:2652 length:1260 start_codon:yes stop_codon:yes gene_type:complete